MSMTMTTFTSRGGLK